MIYIRIIFASIALFAIVYMIRFLNTQGLQQVPAAKVLLQPSSYPSHIQLVNPTGTLLDNTQPGLWSKVSIKWCETRQTEIHYFQDPKQDIWSLKEVGGQWIIKQGQGEFTMEPVSVEKWLAANCFILAYLPKEGLKFSQTPELPYTLKVVYVDKSELLLKTDGKGLFEQKGQIYYAYDFDVALKALAQSASVHQ